MNYHIIPVTHLMQNCCIIWCKSTRESAIIDPGGNAENIKQKLLNIDLKPTKILITHGHWDHVSAAVELSKFYQIPILGPQKFDEFLLKSSIQNNVCNSVKFLSFVPNYWLSHGEIIKIGLLNFEVIHCPGHTPGHVVFFYRKGRFLISGDVIFNNSIGRTDFPRSSHQDLLNSIEMKLFPLGDDITFIPGHGDISTLGFEKINNPYFKSNI
ncbi:hypothetical protein CRV09_00340 [Candidatus Pantoea edessiphila]|uniref:Metallo-beta-lactamase domain-containing protein n=1 Tax=Candidatus Pantoea edessiphila TaxID=2044610 RepID=A0A2P5T2C7_9GAMM|nr:MBL fold metallo-hydrolase [Candidatus Pantoea edessiphila]PPI88754.1 hypothetical protein CRV09_00340 [Candidatus Pantoea edessiphila]